MAKATEIYKTPELDELEHELLQAREMLELAKAEYNTLRDRYVEVMVAADKKRTEHFRVVSSSSSGSLDTYAVARHFGCTPQFLQQFRRQGKKSLTIKYLEPKGEKGEKEKDDEDNTD